jgi:hypothetical protein
MHGVNLKLMLDSLDLCLIQQSFLTSTSFVKKLLLEGINENEGDFHRCCIVSFLKMRILKRSVQWFSRS